IRLAISSAQPAKFPLYLRIPGWCGDATIKVNGERIVPKAEPRRYVRIEREWRSGDRVQLELPMQVTVRRWIKNNQAASVDYGPLAFALKIGERWSRYGGTDAWPEMEVFPTTSWNYGLVLDEKNPAKSFKVVRRKGALPDQPFTPATAPIELKAKARKIP